MAKSKNDNRTRDEKQAQREAQRAEEFASQGFRIYNADGTLAYESKDK